jgi:hypothetical protein
MRKVFRRKKEYVAEIGKYCRMRSFIFVLFAKCYACHQTRAGSVARRGDKRNAYRVLAGKSPRRRLPEELGVDENITLKKT